MSALPSEAIVTGLLSAAQLTVSDEELAKMIADYPVIRRNADALYLAELEPFEPAVTFNPLDYYRA